MAFPEGLRPGAPRGVLPCEPDPADEALKVTRTLERNFRKLYTHSLGLSFRVMDLFIGTWIGFLGLSRELIRPILPLLDLFDNGPSLCNVFPRSRRCAKPLRKFKLLVVGVGVGGRLVTGIRAKFTKPGSWHTP